MQAACREAPTVEDERRAGAERTLNMCHMAVTLDVSMLSGWLNEDASCRVKRGSVRRGGRHAGWGAGGRGVVAAQAARRKAPTVEAQGRARAERT